MAKVYQGWAYVSGSGVAGGASTQIQFNTAGALAGSNDLTWDGSKVHTTNLSASVSVSASAFYGDGSNLTGVTASAVNVADGPEFALQFRKDTPVTGEISGSKNLMFETSTNQLNLTGTLHVKDATISTSGLATYNDVVVAKNTTAGVSIISSDGTAAALNLGSPADVQGSLYGYIPGANYSQIGHARAGGYVKLTSGNSLEALRLDANQHVSASNDLSAAADIYAGGHIHSKNEVSASGFYGSGTGLTSVAAPSSNPYRILTIDGGGSGVISDNSSDAIITATRFQMGMQGTGPDGLHFTSALTGTLHVSGTNYTGGQPSQLLLNVTSVNTGSVFLVSGSGQVGINTDVPNHELTVSGAVSASSNVSASAFYGDGSNLTNLPGGGGIFSVLDSSNAATTSSVFIGSAGVPQAALTVSGSEADVYIAQFETGSHAYIRLDGGTSTARSQVWFAQNGTNKYAVGSSQGTSPFLEIRDGTGTAYFKLNSSATQITGALEVSSNVSASSNISASAFYGDALHILPRTIVNSTDAGAQGEICWDQNYIYVCTGSASGWVRAALTTW